MLSSNQQVTWFCGSTWDVVIHSTFKVKRPKILKVGTNETFLRLNVHMKKLQIFHSLIFAVIAKQQRETQGRCLLIQRYFCAVYGNAEKEDRKKETELEIPTHFSEIINQQCFFFFFPNWSFTISEHAIFFLDSSSRWQDLLFFQWTSTFQKLYFHWILITCSCIVL